MKFLFVGERRSKLAIKMGVTWKDRRLAAAQLSKATDAIGLDWDKLVFMNVFEDDIEQIKNFDGIVIAMGRKVERELKKFKIVHIFICHPAARGAIRSTEKYKDHVRNKIGNIASLQN